MNVSNKTRNRRPLKLKPQADGVPLVFTPDLWGNALYCRDLVARLSPGICPVALPLTETALAELDAVTMESLAKDFADLLAETWPVGPLHLAGFSFAGLLAFETARALEAQGRPASHIWLFDTRAHRLHMPTAIRRAPLRELKSMLSYAGKRLLSRKHSDCTVLHSYRLREINLTTKHKAYRPIIRALYAALSRYRPEPSAGTPATLFRIDDAINPYALGWDRLTDGTVRIVPVDGEHRTMMQNEASLDQISDILEADIQTGKVEC